MSSEDYGRDLTGVQNLRKKHKRLEAELAAHEPAIQVSDCLLLREQGHEEKQNHVCFFESGFLCVTLAGVELLM